MAAMMSDFNKLRSKDGDTLLHLLCKGTLYDRRKDFKKKLEKQSYENLKVAGKAMCDKDMTTAVTLLLNGGCGINSFNEKGHSLLDIMCERMYQEVKKCEQRGKKSLLYCEDQNVGLLQAVIDAGAKPTSRNLYQMVKISFTILLHNQAVVGKSWAPSEEELKRTPIAVMCDSGKMLITEICTLVINKISDASSKYEPSFLLRVLLVYLALTHNNVLRGSLLIHLLQNIGIRFDVDHKFANSLLFGDKENPNIVPDQTQTDMLYALDQAISTIAGAKGCDAIRYRCPEIGTTPLHLSVVLGLGDMVTFFIQHPLVKLNILDEEGNSPLMVALHIMKNSRVWATFRLSIYATITKELALDQRQDYDLLDRLGSTALIYVVETLAAMGAIYRERRLYNLIYRDPACQRQVCPFIAPGQTAVMYCVISDYVQSLMYILSQRGDMDLMVRDQRGRTALHLCGVYGRKESAELLIEACPFLCGATDNRGNTPLYYIVENLPAEDSLQLLNKHASHWEINRMNSIKQSALDYYREQVPKSKRDRDLEKAMSHLADIAQMRDSLPDHISEKLCADKSGLRDSVGRRFSRMFRSNATKTHEDSEGYASSLNRGRGEEYPVTVHQKPEALCKSLKSHIHDNRSMTELFEIICTKTTKVDSQNVHMKTALMICAENGLGEQVDFLIKHRSPDLNIADGQGMTALHQAAVKKHLTCVHIILSCPNVDINIQDKLGNSAMFYIVEKFPPNEAVKILGNSLYQWNLDIRNNYDQTAYEYYMEKLTQRHLNERLANVLARRCIPPLPRAVPERTSTGTLTPRNMTYDRLSPSLPGASASGYFFRSASDLDVRNVPKWRSVMKRYRIYIMENFDSHPMFYNYLIQTAVMDAYTSNKIQTKQNADMDKAIDIFEYIVRKDERSYRHFLEALRKSSQGHIADQLETAFEEEFIDSHTFNFD